jgi:predicted permease
MRAIWQDLLLSLRTLRKEPTSAFITSLTLALGIGLCTISFSLIYGVFFRGLDAPEAEELRLIYRSNPSRDIEWMGVTAHDLYDWREQQTSFEALAHFRTGTVNLSGTGEPVRYNGGFVSANIFDVLGIRPFIGSGFRQGDDRAGAPLTLVLGYETWRTRFESNRAVAGTSVLVNGEAATILGVMPSGFRFPNNQELWVIERDPRASTPDRGSSQGFQVFGRLREGVDQDQAEREMALIAQRLAQEYPASNAGVTTRFRTFVEDDTGGGLVAVFGAMQVATFFVLLIAIANVANLLMARATLRTREAAVRTALGASRFRVALPFLTETLILATGGAVIGMGIAYAGVTLFDGATQDVGKPYYMVFALDLPVLFFVAGVTGATALLAGAAPAFQVLKTDLNTTLKDESRSTGVLSGRLTRALVVAEIALSCALLIGAGLMIKSIVKVRVYEYPFATENILTARIGLFETEYPDSAARRSFFRELENRLAALPQARSVALTTALPLNTGSSSIAIEGQVYPTERDYPEARNASITPGFFRTFGTAVVSGRDFTDSDDPSSLPVAIVNQAFVARFFPGTDGLGRRFAERTGRDSLGVWRTIVGVVPDLRMEGINPEENEPWGYYVPLAQRDPRFVSLAIQVAGVDAMAITTAVREAVTALNPNQPIYNVDRMVGVIRQETWFYYVFGTLFIVFGAAALFMATVGLYGVLSFSVSRRTREMGIRMALGASARDVIRLILRQGGGQIFVGLTVGLVMALGLTRVIGLLMFETTPQDPPVFALVILVIAGVGMLASLVPARRATRANPTAALRYD